MENPAFQTGELETIAHALLREPRVLLAGANLLAAVGGRAQYEQEFAVRGGRLDGQNLNEWWLGAEHEAVEREGMAQGTLRAVSDALQASPEGGLQDLAQMPWHAVLTTSIDGVLRAAIEGLGGSRVQPILPTGGGATVQPGRDPLPLALLFGAIDRPAIEELPPRVTSELPFRRKAARRLVPSMLEAVGPRGVLVVEGWTGTDWLRAADMGAELVTLAPGQVHFFSIGAGELAALRHDDDLCTAIDAGRIVTHAASLVDCLRAAVRKSLLSAHWGASETTSGVTLRYAGNRRSTAFTVPIDEQSWRRLSRSATVVLPVEDRNPKPRTADEQYHAFRLFLSGAPIQNVWSDLRRFSYRRPWYDRLQQAALKLLHQPRLSRGVLLVTGQASAGKSVALANLALDLVDRGVPTLFIPAGSAHPDEGQLDSFCQQVEHALVAQRQAVGAETGEAPDDSTTVAIIWDGVRSVDEYTRLATRLASQARRALVVGSSYYSPDGSDSTRTSVDVFKIPIRIGAAEGELLVAHLGSLIPEFATDIGGLSLRLDENFLASLYRMLPETRLPIRFGLLRELAQDLQRLRSELDRPAKRGVIDTSSALTEAFSRALLRKGAEADLRAITGENGGPPDGQTRADADRLLQIVMCVGQFGIPVPQTLALRCLGSQRYVAYRELTERVNLVDEIPRQTTAWDLAPRSKLEAGEVVSGHWPSYEQQLEAVSILAKNLNAGDMSDEQNPHLECVVRALREFGPKGERGVGNPRLWVAAADIVAAARDRLGDAVHPRLLIPEVHFRRTWVIERQRALERYDAREEETWREMTQQLRVAEKASIQLQRWAAASDREGLGAQRFESTVLTEHGCLLGTRQRLWLAGARHLDAEPPKVGDAAKLYELAVEQLREARRVYSENNQAIDATFWISRDRLQFGSLGDRDRATLTATLLECIEQSYELEPSDEQLQDVRKREFELSQLLGDTSRALQVLTRIEAASPADAAVLRARVSLGGRLVGRAGASAVANALADLVAAGPSVIEANRASLLLYTRLWWRHQTGGDFFASERQSLCLPSANWEELARLMSLRLAIAADAGSALAHFHHAWACMQLGRMTEAQQDFAEMRRMNVGVARRVQTLAILSDAAGDPKKFQGEVRHFDRANRAFLWVPDLSLEVSFNPLDFKLARVQRFQPVGPLQIGLNYRGPFAEPFGRYQVARGGGQGGHKP